MAESIIVEKESELTIATLNREKVLNAFDWESLYRLQAVVAEFDGYRREYADRLCEKNPMSLAAIKLMLQEHGSAVDSRDSLLEAMSVSLLSKSDYALGKIAEFENKRR